MKDTADNEERIIEVESSDFEQKYILFLFAQNNKMEKPLLKIQYSLNMKIGDPVNLQNQLKKFRS